MASISGGMSAASTASAAPDPRRWWTLAATSFGLFMALLDVTIVNVALPTIGDDLHASFADLQWVVNAYTLTLAVLLVTAGRLGDIFGRKRLFMLGLGLFSFGSLLAAVSGGLNVGSFSHIQVLLAARVVQGAGGSIMLPLALAIIAATFQGRERGTAIGIYGGVTGLGTAIGPVLGGLLVKNVSWQSIFYINVPIGIIGIALCAWAIKESYDQRAPRSVDLVGLATLTIGLFCLVLALIQGNDADKGWTSPYILTLFAVSVVALVGFVLWELRARYPMMDPRLFANGSFTGAAIVAFALSGGLFSLFFFLTLYLQNFLGFSALDAGIRFLPLSGLVFFTAPFAGTLSHRFGTRSVLVVGMAVLVVAVLLMARIAATDTQSDWVVLLPAFALAGLGTGLVSPPISTIAVNTVSRNRAGMASGVSGVCRQLGTAFGIALLGAVLTNRYNSGLQSGIAGLSVPRTPPAQQHAILSQIIAALQQAGTFAGSTGLAHPPAQFAQFARMPIFPQIQGVVRASFIDGERAVLFLGAGLLALGLLAALLLVKESDMSSGAAAEAAQADDRAIERAGAAF